MCSHWELKTAFMWSEKVFSMVNDGRLESGWSDRYAIKDIQHHVYAIGVHLNENK